MYLHVIVTYVSDRYIFPIADTDAGFIHSLSPLKRARNGRDYYNFTLQTSPTKFTKVIGFDKKPHTQAQHFHTAGSPAKLLNINDKQGDIFVNQTSSIVQASSSDVHFESSEPTSQDDHKFSDATDVNLKELNDLSRNQKVNVTGVLTLGDKPPKEVIKRNGEKGLIKEDCVIEDLTGVATIHIWDHLLTKLTSGKGYKFENLTVKNYSGTTLLGTAPVTTYEETNLELESTKGPELLSNTERDLTVAEFNYVDKVNIFMTCQLKTCNVAPISSTSSIPLADQPFVVGPGFSPVPAKLVNQIVAGKYIDLSKLLAANLVHAETEPQLLFNGHLVLTTPPRKQRRRIEDICSWMEAFTIFSLVLMSVFPLRWKDLTMYMYKLLILRTHRHFSGRVWLAYDQAFREHAAATRLADWSAMNAQLFNFHAAGASVRGSSVGSSTDSSEPTGSNSSLISGTRGVARLLTFHAAMLIVVTCAPDHIGPFRVQVIRRENPMGMANIEHTPHLPVPCQRFDACNHGSLSGRFSSNLFGTCAFY